MARIIEAVGGVAHALKVYDKRLRIRWSHEKKKWAIERIVPKGARYLLVPPVVYERIPGTKKLFKEKLLPEYSDRRICWDSKTSIIAYCKKVTWDVYDAIVSSDCRRATAQERVKSVEDARVDEIEYKHRDRAREAYKFMRWANGRTLGAGRLR